jgi:hypothetical protein
MALSVVAALALSACGNGESTSSEQPTFRPPKPQASGFANSGRGGSHEGSASIALQFPEPTPQPGSPPSVGKAIDAGRKACKGKTPVQVRDEFIAEAEAAGLLNAGQKKMLANIARYEKQAADSPDFVAGQLGAGVYEATLPEQLRIFGYQGCVYELAQQLQKEIAQRQNG